MLAKGGPYVPREIPAGLGGTSPTTGGDVTGSGCGVDSSAQKKDKKDDSETPDNKV